MPIPVLAIVFRDVLSYTFCSVLASTLCIYLLEVDLAKLQYQYGYSTLWVMAFNGARTSIGIFCIFVQYQYGYSTLPVLAFQQHLYHY